MLNEYTKSGRGILLAFALSISGCAMNPDLAMKIEPRQGEPRILLGEFIGSLALIHGDPKTARVQASDGQFSCEGASNSGTFKTDFRKNNVTHLFRIKCSNGSHGEVMMKISMRGDGSASGIAVGKLNDGSKVKIVVGDMTGTLSW